MCVFFMVLGYGAFMVLGYGVCGRGMFLCPVGWGLSGVCYVL